jgi:hypothetical protein
VFDYVIQGLRDAGIVGVHTGHCVLMLCLLGFAFPQSATPSRAPPASTDPTPASRGECCIEGLAWVLPQPGALAVVVSPALLLIWDTTGGPPRGTLGLRPAPAGRAPGPPLMGSTHPHAAFEGAFRAPCARLRVFSAACAPPARSHSAAAGTCA